MRTFRIPKRVQGLAVIILLTGLGWCAAWSDEAKPAPSKHPEFNTYRILMDRNAFDATRNSKAKRDAQADAAAPPPPPQTLRLLGTWIEGDDASALFEGDGASPREGVKRGGTLAGYTVEDIRTDAVVLRKDQETVELKVGSGLEKGKDDKWSVVEVLPERKPDPAPTTGGWAPKTSDDDNTQADVSVVDERRKFHETLHVHVRSVHHGGCTAAGGGYSRKRASQGSCSACGGTHGGAHGRGRTCYDCPHARYTAAASETGHFEKERVCSGC